MNKKRTGRGLIVCLHLLLVFSGAAGCADACGKNPADRETNASSPKNNERRMDCEAGRTCGDDGWYWQNPLPQGNGLKGVWGSSSTDVIAVGDYGTILRFDGSVWLPMRSGTRVDLHRAWGTSMSDIYAVGGAPSMNNAAKMCTILHYNGSVWERIPYLISLDLRIWGDLEGLWGVDEHDLFVAGSEGSVFHVDPSSWRKIRHRKRFEFPPVTEKKWMSYGDVGDHAVVRLNSVWGISRTDVFSVGDVRLRPKMPPKDVIIHLGDGGWSVAETGATKEMRGIWGPSSSDVLAVGSEGTVLHYDGMAWTKMSTPTEEQLNDVWGSSGSDAFVVGDHGTILHFDGTDWAAMESGVVDGLSGVWGSSGTDVFAVGDGGVILHYDGAKWTEMSRRATTATLRGVWSESPSNIYAAADAGGVLHYDGSTWARLKPAIAGVWRSVWGTSAKEVFVGGGTTADESERGGIVLRYDGSTWQASATGLKYVINAIWGSSRSSVFAAGKPLPHEQGEILRFDGAGWTPTKNGGGMNLAAIWGLSRRNVFAVGGDARGGLIVRFNGWSWTTMNDRARTSFDEKPGLRQPLDGYTLTGVWGASRNNIFAIGSDGRTPPDVGVILRWDGKEWLPVEEGIRATPRGIWGSSASDAWAVGDNGLILHYNGVHWFEMESGTARSLLAVTGTSAGDVYAVGEGGAVLHFGGKPPIVK
jgi:hypothetical protein